MIADPVPGTATEFKVVSQSDEGWNVQFRIDVAELLDQQVLLRHLRGIKQKLARMHQLPEIAMQFDRILEKTRNEEFVDVVVCIRRVTIEKGNPRVDFKDGIAPDGTRYARMLAHLDIMYLDQFEKPITAERVQLAVSEAGIAKNLIDQDIIQANVAEVLKHHRPIKGIRIAAGIFPDVGQDAELEFYFQAVAEAGATEDFYSSRRVSRGDPLCRKHPPTAGEKAGCNLLGEVLPSRTGLDIDLKAESGATLSIDGLECTADIDGVVVIQRTLRRVKTVGGVKEMAESISTRVNPVLQIEGDKIIDVATSHTVEVVGNLLTGSRILTDCEVYVSGDVENDVQIDAGDNVIVEGQIRGAAIHSDANIIAQQDVTGAQLVARDQVIVKGRIRGSRISGDTISAGASSGSNLLARRKIVLDRIDADEGNILSTITVGMQDYFQQRAVENELFLQKARENLLRIEMLLGKEIMNLSPSHSVQTVLMRFMARNHLGQDVKNRKQIEVYRKLIESISPTQAMIVQKTRENEELKLRIQMKEKSEESMIVVREKMTSRTVMAVDGTEAEVPPQDAPVTVRADGENLVISDAESPTAAVPSSPPTSDAETT